ncbi:hypothetical protein C1A50_1152 [Paenibacillus polymyxa]|nr:hypothetical protein C1A50_1152 [Paenibacillus polymyxa]
MIMITHHLGKLHLVLGKLLKIHHAIQYVVVTILRQFEISFTM